MPVGAGRERTPKESNARAATGNACGGRDEEEADSAATAADVLPLNSSLLEPRLERSELPAVSCACAAKAGRLQEARAKGNARPSTAATFSHNGPNNTGCFVAVTITIAHDPNTPAVAAAAVAFNPSLSPEDDDDNVCSYAADAALFAADANVSAYTASAATDAAAGAATAACSNAAGT